MIGSGSYGNVYLVELKTTGERFALKTTQKDADINYKLLETEIIVLTKANHPFLCKLEYFF